MGGGKKNPNECQEQAEYCIVMWWSLLLTLLVWGLDVYVVTIRELGHMAQQPSP